MILFIIACAVTTTAIISWLIAVYYIDNMKNLDKEWNTWYNKDRLKGIRFGQYWCNKYNVTDNILFYMVDDRKAKQYIEEELDDELSV